VAGSVVLLAGPPGIGKSTLLLQWLSSMATGGASSLLVSGEESRAQVAARARRLGVPVESVTFAPGRDLHSVLAAARATRPNVLAVTLTTTELGALVAGARMALDALRNAPPGTTPAEAIETLERVLADYDRMRARLHEDG